VLVILACGAWGAFAHELRPAYLELRQTDAETYSVLWKVPGRGESFRLALYVQLPPGSIAVTEPQGSFVDNAFIERWSIKRPGGLAGGMVRISGLDATLTDALVRVQRLDKTVQVARLTPASTAFVVEDSPSVAAVATTYLKLGVEHILLGYDHLLFLLALVMIVRSGRMMIATVTAFTVAHSITLAAAALGAVRVPPPPVEAAIALSIVFVAAEIVRLRRGEASLTVRYPWVVAFAFGLLHGLGFAGALLEIGLPQRDVPLALLMFNVGVELGQLAFIGAILALVALYRRIPVPQLVEARMQPLAIYGIGALASFWFFERVLSFGS
jgi:hydrogenase/urease accessory protein HupE